MKILKETYETKIKAKTKQNKTNKRTKDTQRKKETKKRKKDVKKFCELKKKSLHFSISSTFSKISGRINPRNLR